MEKLPIELQEAVILQAIKNSSDVIQGKEVKKSCATVCKMWHEIDKKNALRIITLIQKLPLKTIDTIPLYCTYFVQQLYAQNTSTETVKKLELHRIDWKLCLQLMKATEYNPENIVFKATKVTEGEKDHYFLELPENSSQVDLGRLKQLYKQVVQEIKQGWYINPWANPSTEDEFHCSKQSMKIVEEYNLMRTLIQKFKLESNAESFKDTVSEIIIHLKVKKDIFETDFQPIFKLNKPYVLDTEYRGPMNPGDVKNGDKA